MHLVLGMLTFPRGMWALSGAAGNCMEMTASSRNFRHFSRLALLLPLLGSCSPHDEGSGLSTYVHGRAAYQICIDYGVPATLPECMSAVPGRASSDPLEGFAEKLNSLGFRSRVADVALADITQNSKATAILIGRDRLVVIRSAGEHFEFVEYPESPVSYSRAEVEGTWPGRAVLIDSIPNRSPGTSQLRTTTCIKDFGIIQQGSRAEVTFDIRNPSQIPITISRIATSCGCTLADIPLGVLKPGESTAANVVFDSTGKQGFQDNRCVVFSSDGQLSFLYSGFVAVPNSFSPRILHFGEVSPSSTCNSRRVVFRGTRQRKSTLILWAVGSNGVKAAIQPQKLIDQGLVEQDLNIAIDCSAMMPGEYRGAVAVAYQSRDGISVAQVPVDAYVQSDTIIRSTVIARVSANNRSASAVVPRIDPAHVRDITTRSLPMGITVASEHDRRASDPYSLLIKVKDLSVLPAHGEIEIIESDSGMIPRTHHVELIIRSD